MFEACPGRPHRRHDRRILRVCALRSPTSRANNGRVRRPQQSPADARAIRILRARLRENALRAPASRGSARISSHRAVFPRRPIRSILSPPLKWERGIPVAAAALPVVAGFPVHRANALRLSRPRIPLLGIHPLRDQQMRVRSRSHRCCRGKQPDRPIQPRRSRPHFALPRRENCSPSLPPSPRRSPSLA